MAAAADLGRSVNGFLFRGLIKQKSRVRRYAESSA
jgi:hypothetical protein